MSTYRDAPVRSIRPIRTIAVGRSPVLLAIIVLFAAVAGGFAYAFTGGEHLACSQEMCSLSTWHFIEGLGRKETFPRADLQRADVDYQSSKDKKENQHETFAIIVTIRGEQRVLGGGYSNTDLAEKQAFVNRTNAFIGGEVSSLDARRTHYASAIGWAIAVSIFSAAYWFFRVRVAIDTNRRVVTIYRSAWNGWRRELPLDTVIEARIHQEEEGGKLLLRHTQGTDISLTAAGYPQGGRLRKAGLAINAALRAAASVD
jgi:hypothetical protein